MSLLYCCQLCASLCYSTCFACFFFSCVAAFALASFPFFSRYFQSCQSLSPVQSTTVTSVASLSYKIQCVQDTITTTSTVTLRDGDHYDLFHFYLFPFLYILGLRGDRLLYTVKFLFIFIERNIFSSVYQSWQRSEVTAEPYK